MNTFSERLDLIMKTLKLSGAKLSDYSGLDRSGISRFKSGRRVPARDSATAAALTDGILKYADDSGNTDVLKSLIKCGASGDQEEIRSAITGWLFENMASDVRSQSGKRTGRDRYFASRFDRVMILSGFSNIRISQLLNVDASLISRYRSGVRSPRSNPQAMHQIASVLWQRINSQNSLPELAEIMGVPIPEDINEETLFKWLCEAEDPEKEGDLGIERLLSAINNVTVPRTIPPAFLSEFSPDISVLSDRRREYTGFEGLQAAVIRFLSTVITENAPELLLYSDQGIEWMVDPSFRDKWGMLMTACVRKGIKIRIIHNIDRDLEEMNSAIISWLPLYTTGMIESFYPVKPGGDRFSHTLFLAPGLCCIEASHVLGTESFGTYRYHVEKEKLEFFERSFNLLMEGSRSLVKFLPFRQQNLPGEDLSFEKDGILSRIFKDSVVINPVTGPDFSIVFNHPLMSKAFRAYADRILNP